MPYFILYLKTITKQCAKTEKEVEKVYCNPDTLYLLSAFENEDTTRTRTNEKDLVRTIVRLPKTDYEEIKEFCSRLSISISEYVNALLTGCTDMMEKKAKVAADNVFVIVQEESKKPFLHLADQVNRAVRQVRIAGANVDAFIRDTREDLDMVNICRPIIREDDRILSIGDFFYDAQLDLQGAMESLSKIAEGYLDLIGGDPVKRMRAGKCDIKTRTLYETGLPEVADIVRHPELAGKDV